MLVRVGSGLKVRGSIISTDSETTGMLPWGGNRRVKYDFGTKKDPKIEYRRIAPAAAFVWTFCDQEGNTDYLRAKVDPITREVKWNPKQLALVHEFWTNEKITKIGHNLRFDVMMAEASGAVVRGKVIDTQIVAYVATSGQELTYALKQLCKKWFNYSDSDERALLNEVNKLRHKAKQQRWSIATKEFAGIKPQKADMWLASDKLLQAYGVGDAIRAMLVYMAWWEEIQKDIRTKEVCDREHKLFWVLKDMESTGVRIYRPRVRSLIKFYDDYRAEQRTIAEAHGGAGLNFKSTPQMSKVFYELRHHVPTYTGTFNEKLGRFNYSLNGEALLRMGQGYIIQPNDWFEMARKDDQLPLGAKWVRNKKSGARYIKVPPDPLAKAVLEHNAAQQTNNSFLHVYRKYWTKESPGVWVLHPGFKQTGAITGRLSCVAKGTPIEVLRDRSKHPIIPIEKVKPGDWVYAFDRDGELTIRKVKKSWRTGYRKVLRIHWLGSEHRHSGYVDVTPEHLIRMTDGTWCQARNLKPKDRVSALHRGPGERSRLYATGNRTVSEQRFVCRWFHGDGQHSHHIDGNPQNNLPDNLESLTYRQHKRRHPASIQLREKRSRQLQQQWDSGKMPVRYGEDNPRWKGLTSVAVRKLLKKYNNHIMPAAWEFEMDYGTFITHVQRTGFKIRKELRPVGHNQWTKSKTWNKSVSVAWNHEIVRIEWLRKPVDVYDLQIEDSYNFIAGELCVHNCSDPNLQQVASETTGRRKADIQSRPREAFGPRPGYLWYLPDYSQIEVWLFAYLSGEKAMQKALMSGMDFHGSIAKQVFGERDDFEDLADYYRKCAKLIMFCKLYGGGVPKVAKLLKSDLDTAAEFVAKYEMELPGVKRFMSELIKEATEVGTIWSPFGRRYTFDKNYAYRAVNYLIQGTAADVMKNGLINVWQMLKDKPEWKGVRLLVTVHDEMILEVPKHLHCLDLMTDIIRAMQMDSKRLGLPVRLPVEMKIAKTRWSRATKIKLPPEIVGGPVRKAA